MRHSACIGRIGALACALGVGIGLGNTPAVALAEDTSSSSASSERTPSKPQRPTSEPAGTGSEGTATDSSDDTDGGSVESGAGRSDDAETEAAESKRAKPVRDAEDDDELDADVVSEAAQPDDTPSAEPVQTTPAQSEPTDSPAADIPAPVEATVDIPAPAADEPTPTQTPTSVTLSSILSSLFAPADTPNTPAESPLWLVAAAALRRQIDPATTHQATATSTSLTAEQAEAIRRLGEILLEGPPTAMVATDTRAYLAHAGSKSITVLDTLNGEVLQTISLRYTPTMLTVTPSGNRLYISNGIAGTVSVLDTATTTVIKTIRVGRAPTAIAVNANGSRVYVVNSDDGTVSKISTLTNTVVGKVYGVADGVSEIAVSPDGATIYTLSSTTGEVSRFSSTALRAQQAVTVTAASQCITFSSDGSRVFVADIAGSIRILDAATGQQVDSIAVAAGVPFDIAASPDGETLFVARSGDGKLSVYDIASKTELTSVIANPYEVDGPPLISVSPDGTQLYWAEFGGTRVNVIALTPDNADPVVQTPVVNAPNASGDITGSVIVTDPEGRPLTYEVVTSDRGSVTITRGADGAFAFTYRATSAARHAAAADDATAEDKQDTFVLTFTDGQRGVVSVPITVTIPPANTAPTATARSTVSWLSARVLGTITARDADRDALTFVAGPTAKGGTVTIGDDGKFTYTPTAAARHAAANANATDADKQDTFDVVIDDGHGGLTTLTVTVKVKPGNDAPSARVRTTPSWFGPEVYGTVIARDQDRDGLTYTASDTAKGGVIVMDSRGRFTYTPAEAARHAAAAAEATAADKQDTFDITVDDGHGGVTTVAVTVRIKPVNATPAGASATELFTNPNSGLTTGRVTAVDADGDALTFRASPSTGRGAVDVAADGTFTYRPTEAAREAASSPFAPSWVRTDRFRVTVDDGHGGVTTLTVRVPIAPNGYVNQAPTDGEYTVGQPNPANGKVSGTAGASDPERDDIYFLGSGPTAKGGTVVVERDGRFVYTPTDAARQKAASPEATDADRQDTFVVTAIDPYAETLAIPVTVSILPWATSIAGSV